MEIIRAEQFAWTAAMTFISEMLLAYID